MEILGKAISDKTAEHIQAIESTLKKPVIYKFTDPQKTQSYGQCDPWQKDAYYVYSKEALFNSAKKNQINIPFETNLLHELSHLRQIEEGFPHTSTQENARTAQDPAFYDKFGATFVSSILDLNVDFRLKEMGYNSEYFYQNRIIRAEKTFAKMRKGEFPHETTFLTYACMLTCLQLTYAGAEMDHLMGICQEKIPGLSACVDYLSTNIKRIGYVDGFSTFKDLVFLFETFNLWISHSIIYRGWEFTSMAEVLAVYPDIRTWEAPPRA